MLIQFQNWYNSGSNTASTVSPAISTKTNNTNTHHGTQQIASDTLNISNFFANIAFDFATQTPVMFVYEEQGNTYYISTSTLAQNGPLKLLLLMITTAFGTKVMHTAL